MRTIVHIGGMLILEGEDFLRCAYLNLLGRGPDEMGRQFYLFQLYKGLRKEAIIFDLFKSPECNISIEAISGLGGLIKAESRRRRFPGLIFSKLGKLFSRRAPQPLVFSNATLSAPTSQMPAVVELMRSGGGGGHDVELSAAIEGLDHANQSMDGRVQRLEALLGLVKKHVDTLFLDARVTAPWTVASLIRLDGRDFVESAYDAIVRRKCKVDECNYFLELLRRGEDKNAILTHLCESWEVAQAPSRSDAQDARIDHIGAALEGMELAGRASFVNGTKA